MILLIPPPLGGEWTREARPGGAVRFEETPPDCSLGLAATLSASRGGINKTHIAPVLGGGRFTQPGADGGEC